MAKAIASLIEGDARMNADGLSLNDSMGSPSAIGGHVYEALALHQSTVDGWELRELVRQLHEWSEVFNLEFKLEIPERSLCVDRLRASRKGHFRYGLNGFGLKGEIGINLRHVRRETFWDVLATLLHELLHAWQQAYGEPGKRNYHNKKYREHALSLGLEVDQRGRQSVIPDGPFVELLRRRGVEVPDLPTPRLRIHGQSKLKLWTCGCTRVRVAVAEFHARCLRCGNLFVRDEHALAKYLQKPGD